MTLTIKVLGTLLLFTGIALIVCDRVAKYAIWHGDYSEYESWATAFGACAVAGLIEATAIALLVIW